MSQPVRHLHRDYGTAHCGKDISHLLATLDENEATCKACQTGLVQFRKDEAAAAAKAQQEREAEEARRLEEAEQRKRQHAEREREAIEAAQRQEERLRILEAELARLKGAA
jgi:hypothetical protein